MKKASVLIVVVSVFLLAFKSENRPSATFSISATLEGAEDNLLVRLKPVGTADLLGTVLSEYSIDTTRIVGGKFELKGHVNYPWLYHIEIVKDNDDFRNNQVIQIFLENDKYTISAIADSVPTNDKLFQKLVSPHENLTIKGGKLHNKYINYLSGIFPIEKQWHDLYSKDYTLYLNHKGPDKPAISKGVEIVKKIENTVRERDSFNSKFIKENGGNCVGLYVANKHFDNFTLDQLDNRLAQISDEMKALEIGKVITGSIQEMKKVAPGEHYIDFELKDPKGNLNKLSDFVGKGNYVLLEFWASWCTPCRADIPHLKEVYELYNPEGFQIVSISFDQDNERWLKAVEQEKMKWTQLCDPKSFGGDLGKTYKIPAIPTCILIDPNGKIVTKNMRGSFMDKRLIEMYGNKFGDKF